MTGTADTEGSAAHRECHVVVVTDNGIARLYCATHRETLVPAIALMPLSSLNRLARIHAAGEGGSDEPIV